MADDHTFILPVVIDDTAQAGARVPEKFLSVQWSRLPAGQPTAAFEALCRRLAAGETQAAEPVKQAWQGASATPTAGPQLAGAGPAVAVAVARDFPEFPLEEPGQKTRFWLRVIGWGLQWLWVAFNRLPKWIRYVAYVWLIGAVLTRACSTIDDSSDSRRHSDKLSPVTSRKLKEIADNYQGSSNKADIARLASQIAGAFADEGATTPKVGSPLLAIPFGAPAGDPEAQKLADSTFALVYGRVAVSRHGQIGLSPEPLPSLDPEVALERGRTNKSTYVLYGAIDKHDGVQELTVKILTVEDGSVKWSKFYPVAGADAAKIAAEVDSKVPRLEED